jgi:hypothetical protein
MDTDMRRLLLGLVFASFALPVAAQQNPNDRTTRYDVQEVNFDLWCQETEGLPATRCDKRTPDDEAKFEAYRDRVEKYELPYLKRKNSDQDLNRIIIHADPVPSENPANRPTDHEIASPKPNP